MNPYMRNRRFSYTDAQMLPSSIQYNRNVHNERHKMVSTSIFLRKFIWQRHFSTFPQYEESSPPPKRTKRKPKPDPPAAKQDTKNEIMKVNQSRFAFEDTFTRFSYRMSRHFPDFCKPSAEQKLDDFLKLFSRRPKVRILTTTIASNRMWKVRSRGILILSMDQWTCKQLSRCMAAKPNTIHP